MLVITNQIDTDSVRTVEEDGQTFLVAPVVLARAIELNGGYLPRREIERSANAWNGVPVPIDHPAQGGEPISIDDDRASVPVIGEIRNAEAKQDGEFLTGELWINVELAQAAGSEGERVLTRLKNGDALEVSTGYAPGRVVAGNFDGAHRDRAVLDIQPDHLAVLPNDKGRCSIQDHCGAGAPLAPVANKMMVANMADDGPHTPEDIGELFNHAMTDHDADPGPYETLGRKVANALGLASTEETTPAESGTDDETITNDSMGDKTQELVENHGFDAENLPDESTQCFNRIYDLVTNESEATDEPDADGEQTTEQPATIDVDELADALSERFVTTDTLADAVSEAVAANKDAEQKAEIAEDIVANSDDYEDAEAVIEDFPTVAALEAKRESVQPRRVANYGAARAATPTPSGSDKKPSWSPVASAHAALSESDD